MAFLMFFLLLAVANLGLGYAMFAIWRRRQDGRSVRTELAGWVPFSRKARA
jgi:hypothetical protein